MGKLAFIILKKGSITKQWIPDKGRDKG